MGTDTRIAVVVTHVGTPGTLASTSFVSALMDGLARVGTHGWVVGLAQAEHAWRPEALATTSVSAPWLSSPQAKLGDRLEAARRGILDTPSDSGADRSLCEQDWYRELLLQRELERVAGPSRDFVVMVYPRSYRYLKLVCRIARRRGWKVVVLATEALTDLQIDPATRDAYVAAVTASADGIWAASDYLSDYWMDKGVPDERVLISSSMVSENAFVAGDPPLSSTAIYIGNLAHREIDYLLDISESVRRSIPEFRLAIYGDATADVRHKIEQDVASRDLVEVISVEQPVRPFEVPQILLKADVLVLPRSSGEFSSAGFPKKLGEYLATGRPVVVTRVGDIPKLLVDGESAFLVEPDDCDAFSETLVRVLRDPTMAACVGAGGRTVARRELASQAVATSLVSFVTGLPRRSRERAPMRVKWTRARLMASFVGSVLAEKRDEALYVLGHTRQGHTRIVATKMAIVDLLRLLRLRPPAPKP